MRPTVGENYALCKLVACVIQMKLYLYYTTRCEQPEAGDFITSLQLQISGFITGT